jgi:hypothetical protein
MYLFMNCSLKSTFDDLTHIWRHAVCGLQA